MESGLGLRTGLDMGLSRPQEADPSPATGAGCTGVPQRHSRRFVPARGDHIRTGMTT